MLFFSGFQKLKCSCNYINYNNVHIVAQSFFDNLHELPNFFLTRYGYVNVR
jgi:hypothetical protein